MNSEPQPEDALADFQAVLLEVLAGGGPLPEVRAQLQRAADACGLGDYARSFDARMLEVASELVRKWGKKHPAKGS